MTGQTQVKYLQVPSDRDKVVIGGGGDEEGVLCTVILQPPTPTSFNLLEQPRRTIYIWLVQLQNLIRW